MTIADSKITTARIIFVSALASLVSGCSAGTGGSKPVDSNDFPLQVRFDDKQCPLTVEPPAVVSCISPIPDAVCRGKGKRIIWVAVKSVSGNYQLDPNQQFTIAGVPAKKLNRDPCEQSSAGQLECRIDPDAEGSYKYSVTAAGCVLDPRVYVP